eukprot:COSAG05_NODE_10247_length_575_cov_4.981092_1_plen_75_part_00
MACNNAWLFFSFLVMFGTIIAAVWIMVQEFIPKDKFSTQWPGIAMTIQCVCQLLSAVIMFIGRENGGGQSMGGF